MIFQKKKYQKSGLRGRRKKDLKQNKKKTVKMMCNKLKK